MSSAERSLHSPRADDVVTANPQNLVCSRLKTAVGWWKDLRFVGVALRFGFPIPLKICRICMPGNGPYASFGFESIEKQLWRNKQSDRPIRDSEIKAVLSQLFKTDQWLPPERSRAGGCDVTCIKSVMICISLVMFAPSFEATQGCFLSELVILNCDQMTAHLLSGHTEIWHLTPTNLTCTRPVYTCEPNGSRTVRRNHFHSEPATNQENSANPP
ncbi:hypothetical protein AVEN_33353-1 [Araneus ventricosus]|uniref:Uncharacterized protein n=1 Tax=Araneus ventricosus TaxID=182803 RepID=A0A4Y2J8U1_ARAVE|nr:hypothetical protein AVEN_33353-1 [Araneus ventricosus]